MPRLPQSYGEIADAILPSIVLSVRVRDILKEAVGDFVVLEAREQQAFFREQMSNVWPNPIDWKSKPRDPEFIEQWSVSASFSVHPGRPMLSAVELPGFETILQGARSYQRGCAGSRQC